MLNSITFFSRLSHLASAEPESDLFSVLSTTDIDFRQTRLQLLNARNL